MQQRLVDACLIGDVLHARTVDAAPHKYCVGGVEDAGLGVRCGLSRWFNHVVNQAISVPLQITIPRRFLGELTNSTSVSPRPTVGATLFRRRAGATHG